MHFYIIGIKGSGTSALACLLHDLGNSVSGYDDSVGYKYTMEGLDKRKIKVYHGDEHPTISHNTIITASAAVSRDHHEIKRLENLGYRIVPYKEVMGFITMALNSICVCGTHGKTTTTLMLSDILDKAYGCSYFVGDGTGHGNINSGLLVIESCEFNKHFLSYHPKSILLTNIELDHTETYPNIEAMRNTFQEFLSKGEEYKVLCGDDLNIRKLNVKNACYYGFDDKNDLVIKNRLVKDNKTCFDVYYQDKMFDHYEVEMFGDHLILDCAGAILMSIMYEVPKNIIKNTLEHFIPPKRRFSETIIDNNVIIDDYAHHPTEIRVTYDSAHQKYPNKKIIAIFLPNTYSRTEALFDDFVKSLSMYDKAYLMDISCDREKSEDYPNISSEMVKDKIKNAEMISLDTIDKLTKEDNCVFCFMSCANIAPMINKMKEILTKKQC